MFVCILKLYKHVLTINVFEEREEEKKEKKVLWCECLPSAVRPHPEWAGVH